MGDELFGDYSTSENGEYYDELDLNLDEDSEFEILDGILSQDLMSDAINDELDDFYQQYNEYSFADDYYDDDDQYEISDGILSDDENDAITDDDEEFEDA